MSRIATRLWAGMMALVLAVLVLMWLFQIVFLERFYNDLRIAGLERAMVRVAGDIGAVLGGGAPSSAELAALTETLDRAAHDEGATLEWMDTAGDTVYTSDDSTGRGPSQAAWAGIRLDAFRKVLDGKTSRNAMTHPRFGGQYLLVGVPIFLEERVAGALLVTMPLSAVQETADILKRQLFLLSILMSAVAFVLALALARTFSKPIRTITAAARRIAAGSYDTMVRVRNRDEIGQLAQTLEEMARELSRTESLRREFVANVSHELRTPLTLIQGQAESLRDLDRDPVEKKNRRIAVILDETRRLNHMVEEMLDLSRLQAGTLPLERTRFAIPALAFRVVDRFRSLAESQGCTLTFRFDPEEGRDGTVQADEEKIQQVLYNLVQNALQHVGPDGRVDVRARAAGQEVRVEVADNGPGIPPEALPRIWDRFYKGEPSGDGRRKGIGLGLAIAREILSAHDARYGVDSRPGAGTTFWFVLPAA